MFVYVINTVQHLCAFVSSIIRDRGYFGNVSVFWQLFTNTTPLESGMEFSNTSGSVLFTSGDLMNPIVLEAISDSEPEFNEFYTLILVNITGKNEFFPQSIF